MDKTKSFNTIFITLLTGIVLFCLVSLSVISGKINYIDNAILLSLRNTNNHSIPIGPGWLLNFMRDVSALGSVTIVVLITILTSGFLILKKEYPSLRVVLFASISGGIIELLMKGIFSRPRPHIVPHLVNVDSLSYPSGHSAISAIIYLSLIFIIFTLDIKRSIKISFLYSAIFLILLIGISRIYLGVHYPSDVLGGWALGLIWSSISVILAHNFKKG
ncbi:MAG: phosphatase PAP2 family protein [Ignavibacteriaceae bacterium]